MAERKRSENRGGARKKTPSRRPSTGKGGSAPSRKNAPSRKDENSTSRRPSTGKGGNAPSRKVGNSTSRRPATGRGATTKSVGETRSRRRIYKKKAFKVTSMPVVVETDGKVRLNRFLANAGICSRRAADELISSGRVTVDGELAKTLGVRIDPMTADVRLDEQKVLQEKKVYVLFNKPKGVVCTNARNEQRKRVIDFLERVKGRIYTIGRLDADSEGLILLTNDGDFAQEMAHPRYGVPKTYAVLVRGEIDARAMSKVKGGVWLSEGRTSGAGVRIERRSRDKTYLKVTIREGKNREIRRVFAKLGSPVLSLKRVRIGALNLHGLRPGKYRFLKLAEISALRSLASSNDS